MKDDKLRECILNTLQNIAPEADLSSLAPDVDLRRELDIDSFDFLQIIIALHDALGVDIPETDYGQLTTFSGLLDYLSERVGGFQ
jgi:acyl carrier protein